MKCRCSCKWSVNGKCTTHPSLVESDTANDTTLLLICTSFEWASEQADQSYESPRGSDYEKATQNQS